ncbi:MAG: DUF3842 family protein [Oscillospiraceae bacterium]|nr:DUF3842 family protein [Oscillospiraceae bacterium]
MKQKLLIAVVDGQGGGIGKAITARLRAELPVAHVRALGTNSAATNAMLKAGAQDGATGENAIVCNAEKADLIMGVLAILTPNSLLGELTPKMAAAIGGSGARKILIPVDRCNLQIPFAEKNTLQQHIEKSVELAKRYAVELAER